MTLLAFLIIPQIVFAEYDNEKGVPPFTLGDPVVSGNGCPEGSYDVVLSPDGTEISVLFSEFTAMTDRLNMYDFANCNIALPIEVPAGITIGLAGVDYRGLAYIPSGGHGVLTREYFFAGESGPRITSSIDQYDQYDDFFFDDDVPFMTWTECGDDVIARSNATIFVLRPSTSNVQALMSVFSEDWDISILFHLEWKYCKDDENSESSANFLDKL
jgi:hypothetical protein